MNRLLASRGLVERSAASRQLRSSPFKLRHPGFRIILEPTSITVSPLRIRAFSTNLPPDAKPTQVSDLPPSTSTVIHSLKPKHKIELRPGPARTTSTESPVVKTPSAKVIQNTKPPNPALEKPFQPTPPGPAPNEPSILQVAKDDMDAAARHGILEPPPENAGRIRTLWHQLKQLFKFYVAGLKLIYVHRKDVKKINKRVKAGGQPISRWEHRFIKTYHSDTVKLVPFVAMLLLLEEIIPLVVLYAPGLLPSTCLLPSQRERIENKRREKQRNIYHTKRTDFAQLIQLEDARESRAIPLNELGDSITRALCSVLGLSYRGISLQRRIRLSSYLRKIAHDDQMLISEKWGTKLSESEVAEALWERGFIADSLAATEQRKRLTWWLEAVSSEPGSQSSHPRSDDDPVAVRVHLISSMCATGLA